MKEPGQLAAEVANDFGISWDRLSPSARAYWARVEAAIYEDAAKVCRDYAELMIGRADTDTCGKIVSEIAAAIRAKIGGQSE